MIYIKLIFLFFIIINFSVQANDVKIIELHKNKSLDQLVLETETKVNNENSEGNIDQQDSINTNNVTSENTENLNLEEEQSLASNSNNITDDSSSAVITEVATEQIFDIDEIIIKNHLVNINEIKSRTLNAEFIKILSSPELTEQKKINNTIYDIIKKLYEIGEIGKAYNLIREINLEKISKEEYLVYFQLIELNYLLSTFRLSEVCELKSLLLDKNIILPKYLLEKTDIFCLTLENKFAEAKLLNSLLIDSENELDENFQKLFNYMMLKNQNDLNFNSLSSIKSKELIFLYSAMLRINELPLDEDFIKIDPMNLSIPVILSDSTQMDIRIKAANRAFYDDVISIDSLSALYQSVDFNSKEFNKPEETILSLNNNKELIMTFYYQLANIQIFPDNRLDVILDYWQFAKNIGLEKIAYAITKNILESFTPTSENTKFGIEIVLAHISNKNYEEATKWLNLIENSEVNNEQVEYAKFLIALNDSDKLDTIVNYLSNNTYEKKITDNQRVSETIAILTNFLNIESISNATLSYENMTDDRLMPSYFLIKDIKKNMQDQKDLTLFFLSLISMNNKNWDELHPEHLNLILNAYNLYDQGSLIKPIILEILNDLEIIQ